MLFGFQVEVAKASKGQLFEKKQAADTSILLGKVWRLYNGAAHQNPIVEKESFFPNSLGVSKNKGTPKWMIYNGKPY